MTNLEYQQIRSKARKLEQHKKGYLVYLCDIFGCDKIQAKIIYDKLVNNEPLNFKTTPDSSEVIKANGYVYNPLNDKYIVPLKSYGRDYVCPGTQHRAMLSAYSNWQGGEKSIATIARLYKMRREWVIEYFKIMQWTHDTVPITTEEIIQKKDKEAINRVLETRRTELQQELEHADWKSTQQDAENWRLFEAGKLDPFMRVIERWSPRLMPPLKQVKNNDISDEILLIGISDTHFGSRANSEELFSGDDFDSDTIKRIMIEYLQQIKKEVDNRKKKFKEVVVIGLGDFLHSLTGFTVKGTPLESDLLRENQFELALDSLTGFFQGLLEIFPKISVYSLKGNHSGSIDWVLFKTISLAFKSNPRITFNLFKSRQACFKIGSTAVLIDHGASDISKSIMPTTGSGKEAYVQSLFMLYPEILVGAKSKLMLSGDRHKFMYDELKGFEHVIMGSCVTGDLYADSLGLHSRARQNCLVLNNDGVKEVISFYFD